MDEGGLPLAKLEPPAFIAALKDTAEYKGRQLRKTQGPLPDRPGGPDPTSRNSRAFKPAARATAKEFYDLAQQCLGAVVHKAHAAEGDVVWVLPRSLWHFAPSAETQAASSRARAVIPLPFDKLQRSPEDAALAVKLATARDGAELVIESAAGLNGHVLFAGKAGASCKGCIVVCVMCGAYRHAMKRASTLLKECGGQGPGLGRQRDRIRNILEHAIP